MPSYCQNGLHYIVDQLFQTHEAKEYFRRLENEVEYLSADLCKIKIYGKTFPIPRQHVAFGDDHLEYRFSGLSVPAKPWTPLLLDIKAVVENKCGQSFNFLLINRYRTGLDSISFHKDNEKELENSACIASLSLGQERLFVFKRTGFKPVSLSLKSGSLIQMLPPTNELWYHGLPKQRESSGVRLNLTFRKMKSSLFLSEPRNTNKPATSLCLHSSAALSPRLLPTEKSLPAPKVLPAASVKKNLLPFFNMNCKRSASPCASTSKKICTSEVDKSEHGDSSSTDISIDHLPPHHYSLGGDKIVQVSDFRGKISVHFRKFTVRGEKIFPTKEGVVMSAHTFRLFMDELMPYARKVYVLNKQLVININTDQMESATYRFQQFTTGYDQFLKFKPGEICLTKKQYEKLCDSVEEIWLSINQLQFGPMFRQFVMQQITPSSATSPSGTEDLTFILADVVMIAVEKHIDDVYFCPECHKPDELFPNQLQHACCNISREDKWRRYFDEGVSLLDITRLANAFVCQSGELSAYISEEFLVGLNIPRLLETVKAMY